MRKFQPVSSLFDINISTYIDEITENRQGLFKVFLDGYKPRWKTESNELTSQHENENVLDTTNLQDVSAHKTSFTYLYNNGENERAFIKQLRNDSKSKVCPYCGSPGCGTLDHYYPKGLFPQFSVIPDNLIPCCYRCNKIKDEDYPTVSTDRYLHPYFDSFLTDLIYELEFRLIGDAVYFDIKPHRRLTDIQASIVDFHMRGLKMKNFHTESILTTFETEKSLIQALSQTGMDDVKIKEILSKVVLNGVQQGMTYDWSIIVKESLAINDSNFELVKNM